jgi:zinc/manganese transport system substrate-binding protein
MSQQSSDNADNKQINIVTSLDFYAEMAEAVAGDVANVTPIIADVSIDPHDYEPTANVAKQYAKADVIISNGGGYDAWSERFAQQNKSANSIVVADLVNYQSGQNEHLWYLPQTPEKLVDALVENLSALQPDEAKTFQANADKYLKTLAPLTQLRQEVKKAITGKAYLATEPVFDNTLLALGAKQLDSGLPDEHDHNHDHGDEHADHEHEDEATHDHEASALHIDGLSDHYHSGDAVALTAHLEQDSNHDHWHWYTLAPGKADQDDNWVVVKDAKSDSVTLEDVADGTQVKVKLFDDDHHVVAESEAVTVHIDDHHSADAHETDGQTGDFANAVNQGQDPTPTAIKTWQAAIESGDVAFVVNNPQNSSNLVKQAIDFAKEHDVPVVQATETKPKGQTFVQWQTQQLEAILAAVEK